MDALVQRLVQNPHDQDAIFRAHSAGQQDPRSYAMLLEKVGTATSDPALASHWLTEAANVWVVSLNDAHRAARALMIAIERDPTQAGPADRLAELYREKGDTKALAALLERRAKAMAPLGQRDPAIRGQIAAIHEELGRLWAEAPLSNPAKAIENYRRAVEYDPSSQYSIYAVREALKASGQMAEAIPYFAMEQALVEDPERKVSLYADEAESRISIGDQGGALAALDAARRIDANDVTLKQQVATLVLEHVRQGKAIDDGWKVIATDLFIELAEQYPGEHGFAYAVCAAELAPAHDRATQLSIFYAEQLGKTSEVTATASAYLQANPNGAVAADAKRIAGDAPAPARAARPAPAQQEAPRAAPRRSPPQEHTVDDMEGAAPASSVPRRPAAAAPARAPVEEPASSGDLNELDALILKAAQFAAKNRKNEAAATYREVLGIEPTHPEALSFLQGHLRASRKYADLRDTLLRAARSEQATEGDRIAWFKEVASVCESQLRDFETASQAYHQILALDPTDTAVRDQLRKLLERANRWDDLCALLETDAREESDQEARIALEKQLAKLHEVKRKDPVGAGSAWARIAALSPDDDTAIATALKFFDKAERPDLAAEVIAENVGRVSEPATKGALYKRLGDLRRSSGEPVLAADAFSEGARALGDVSLWEAAEQAYVSAEAWVQAAAAASERAALASSPRARASLLAVEAGYLRRAGDSDGSIARLETAVEADPTDDGVAEALEAELAVGDRMADVALLLLRRAESHPDAGARVQLRKRAAKLQRETLGDPSGARESLVLVLKDRDDAEALATLADDAEERGEFGEAAEYLARWSRSAAPEQRAEIVLREARLLADGLKNVEAAVERYTELLDTLDPRNEEALEALANLEEQRGKYDAAAMALERHLTVAAAEAKSHIAGRLADLYEAKLDDHRGALRSLGVVYAADSDDFDALGRMVVLAEKLEDWAAMAEHLTKLAEVEGDEEEVSRMTLQLADLLSEKLDRGEEALSVLAMIADQGDEPCRDAFVELGDRLGKKDVVAAKLVEWFGQAPPGKHRDDQLHAAFERLVEVEAYEQAVHIGKELGRMRVARRAIAEKLEDVSLRMKDLDGLAMAHELIVRELSGPARAHEMVRQAETLVAVGVDPLEAVQHGEQALTSVAPEEVEPLLERLGRIVGAPGHVIDLYERQIGRCKAPGDRLAALSRAAQVASERDAFDRARGFFDLALSQGATDETMADLEESAKAIDEARGSKALRTTLAEAFAAGGQGARDGGRTRATLLRRAAVVAQRELSDADRAFAWMGDALVTHVDDAGLDALVDLATEISEPKRAEDVIERALKEVFDGPLVRKLLARRAEIRDALLGDKRGSAEDLKRLHELAPSDTQVMDKLSALYTELEDYRGMVQLYEDQILRGRDPAQRAEVARQVARLWEERLADPREAADAWRRVLRMKAGDPEATAGLERAKTNMLKKPEVPAAGAELAAEAAESAPAEAEEESAGAAPAEAEEQSASDSPLDMASSTEESRVGGLEGPTMPGLPEIPETAPAEPRHTLEGGTMPWAPDLDSPPASDSPPSIPPDGFGAHAPRRSSAPPPPSSRSASVPPPPASRRGLSAPPPPPSTSSNRPPAHVAAEEPDAVEDDELF